MRGEWWSFLNVRMDAPPIPLWTHVGEYLVFLAVCLAGILNATWLWIPIGAMLLLLLGWPRYRDPLARAGKVDAAVYDPFTDIML